MLRAVIFDFDGVITDSEMLHLRSFNKVLASYGIEITTEDYYSEYLGLTDTDCFNLLNGRCGFGLDEQGIENLVKQKNEIFEELAKTEWQIIEGVSDFLDMLKQNEIAMAICSGALLGEIELILKEAGFNSFFEEIVSAEQIRRGKPAPDGFVLTLEKLNHNREVSIAAEECVVIEDSHWGLEGAKAAGMHTVAVTNTYDAAQLQMAEKIVGKLTELSIDDLQKLCS
ncbi:MAG: HAD family hydrolase [Planctomycetota bacterium]|jgi:beta-phosphoglucomutase